MYYANVQRLFRRYDTDGSGTIDAREALGLIADMLAEWSCRPLPSLAIDRRSLRAVGLHRAEHARVHVRAAAPSVVALAGPVPISVPCRAMPSLERRKGARRPAVLRPTPRARLTRSVRWTPTTTATSASRCGRPRLVPRPPRSWLTEALGSTAGLTLWHASVPRARVPRFYMGWPAAVSARLRPCCAAHTCAIPSSWVWAGVPRVREREA